MGNKGLILHQINSTKIIFLWLAVIFGYAGSPSAIIYAMTPIAPEATAPAVISHSVESGPATLRDLVDRRQIHVVAPERALSTVSGDNASAIQTVENAATKKAKILEKKDIHKPYQQPPAEDNAITKPEIESVDTTGKESMDEAIICLARAIYWEAKGTDKTVMHAVANVIMNRLSHDGFPRTICAVVKEGEDEGACQFSWYCDGLPDNAQEKEPYEIAKEISRKALNRQLKDLTGGALYFYSAGAKRSWSKEYIRTAKINGLIFYKPPGGKAK
jgi:spore germination cell wall hydrolase CwlJ-like protein